MKCMYQLYLHMFCNWGHMRNTNLKNLLKCQVDKFHGKYNQNIWCLVDFKDMRYTHRSHCDMFHKENCKAHKQMWANHHKKCQDNRYSKCCLECRNQGHILYIYCLNGHMRDNLHRKLYNGNLDQRKIQDRYSHISYQIVKDIKSKVYKMCTCLVNLQDRCHMGNHRLL